MKKINDPTTFSRFESAKIYRQEGKSVYASINDSQVAQSVLRQNEDHRNEPMLYPISLMRECTGKKYYHRRRHSQVAALEYIRNGSLFFRTPDGIYLAEPGDLFLLKPDEYQEFGTGYDGYCEKSSIVFNGTLCKTLFTEGRFSQIHALSLPPGNKFEDYLTQMLLEIENASSDCTLHLSGLSFELMEYLAKYIDFSEYPPMLKKIIDYMEEHLSENLTVDFLAGVINVSPPTLNKLFQTALKSTPHKKLIQIRMRHAAKMLLEKKLSIKEIANSCGYENQMNFSTEFKKFHKIPPSKYNQYGIDS